MSSYTWPSDLPQCPLVDGYSEKNVKNILRTPMDAGVSKMRSRGRRASSLSVSYAITTAQIGILDAFLVTINNVYRFDIPHPRTGNMVEVRIIPQGDGEMYSLDPILNGSMWKISLILEIMP